MPEVCHGPKACRPILFSTDAGMVLLQQLNFQRFSRASLAMMTLLIAMA